MTRRRARYQFYVPPLREWPGRWWAAYVMLWRACWPYFGWQFSRRELAKLMGDTTA